MSFKKPNFFILGAPKCGTTSLAYWLSQHPEIYISPIKEPHFFNTDHDYHLVNSEKEYYNIFEKAGGLQEAIGEASVWYLYSEEAVKNIESELSNAKYIVMMRNPVEMAVSLHQQQLFAGNENIKNFKDAWHCIKDRKKGDHIPNFCREPKHLYYDDICKLGEQLERLLNDVNRSRVKVIFLEDIKKDPQKSYAEILKFLNVEAVNRKVYPIVNEATVRRSQLLRSVIKNYIWLKNKLKLPRFNTGLMEKIDVLNQRKEKKVLNDKRFRSILIKYFQSDIEILEKLTDRDLSHWKSNSYA